MKYILNKKLIFFIMIKSLLIAQGDMFSSGINRPRANAGPDIKIKPDESIFLDASRSFIRDGSKLKYEWILSPGIALKVGNEFESEISTDFYKNKYLKSVETYKKVIEIIPIKNNPGTKLEVVLRVKDRIGFEDLDTLFIEYIDDPTVKNISENIEILKPPINTPRESDIITNSIKSPKVAIINEEIINEEIINEEIINEETVIDSNQITSGILVEAIKNSQIDILDMKIINSIMADQIRITGYKEKIFFNNNIITDSLKVSYDNNCNTDSCIANNGKNLKVDFVLLWSIDESNENLKIRLFDPKNFNDLIDKELIFNPLVSITELGVYGLNLDIRKAIDKIFYKKIFYKNISRSSKIKRWNNRFIRVGKYPILLGISYLLVDKLFFDNSEEEILIEPPGFPHES